MGIVEIKLIRNSRRYSFESEFIDDKISYEIRECFSLSHAYLIDLNFYTAHDLKIPQLRSRMKKLIALRKKVYEILIPKLRGTLIHAEIYVHLCKFTLL